MFAKLRQTEIAFSLPIASDVLKTERRQLRSNIIWSQFYYFFRFKFNQTLLFQA